MENRYDVIIVGAGFAGISAARLLADQGKKVLIIEERDIVGGNSIDYLDNGILVQPYGPHVFHTNSSKVYKFLTKYNNFYPYIHKVLGNINGKLVPIPFNFKSIELCFDKEEAELIINELKKEYKGYDRVSIFDLLSNYNEIIQKLGEFVYKNVFEIYSLKQWGMNPSMLDRSIINRVPIILGYEDNYFYDKYQCMPKGGFNNLFNSMLNHENISVRLSTKAKDVISLKDNKVYVDNNEFNGIVIYTGSIDELLDYKYGELSYRSLDFKFEKHDVDSYQDSAVVNYNTSEEYTRITEFKKFMDKCDSKSTIIVKEYPKEYIKGKSIGYYSINNEFNNAVYNKYYNELLNYKDVYLLGRLAEYKYYNMDQVVERAIELVDRLTKDNK